MRCQRWMGCLLPLAMLGSGHAQTSAPPVPVTAVAQPLTAVPGDPARGRAIVADRQRGLCLLCHAAPIPEERFQGNLAPSLAGAGTRWTVAQLRARLVDPAAFNPGSVMPSYSRTDGLQRVGASWAGAPVLAPQQVEDVVAWLATLRH